MKHQLFMIRKEHMNLYKSMDDYSKIDTKLRFLYKKTLIIEDRPRDFTEVEVEDMRGVRNDPDETETIAF